MLRHNVPGGLSTGIHYDRIFLRAGESEFLTAWVPIGDCAANGGGLMYIEGSSQLGKNVEADFMARARSDGMTEEERLSGFNRNMGASGQLAQDAATFGKGKGKWITANYEAGDVVFHNPYMVHGAVKNEDFETGRIRLSTDLRFYEEGSRLDERWMKAYWAPDDGL
jgi:phytanoyl-CoA hydroxylase